mmetsp:Transcript_18033/g.44780  ORF Transcript_18033/g.44780 Transcript_18033/m.44780 type:complete len:458 (-) Transcript_18033:297-1670(-)
MPARDGGIGLGVSAIQPHMLSTLDSDRRYVVTMVVNESNKRREEEGMKISNELAYRTIGTPDLNVHNRFRNFKRKEKSKKVKAKLQATTVEKPQPPVTSGDQVLGPNLKDDHTDKMHSRFPAWDLKSSEKYIRALRCGAKTPEDFLQSRPLEAHTRSFDASMRFSRLGASSLQSTSELTRPSSTSSSMEVRPMSRVEKLHYDFVKMKRELQFDLDDMLEERRAERKEGFQSQQHIAMAADLILAEMEFAGRATSPNPRARRSNRPLSRASRSATPGTAANRRTPVPRPASRATTDGGLFNEASTLSESGPSVWYEASVAIQDEKSAKEERDREELLRGVTKYSDAREGKLTPGEGAVVDVVRKFVNEKVIADENLLGAVCQSLTMQQLGDAKVCGSKYWCVVCCPLRKGGVVVNVNILAHCTSMKGKSFYAHRQALTSPPPSLSALSVDTRLALDRR